MRRYKAWAAIGAACFLVSCGGGKLPATRYYTLGLPAAPTRPAAEALPYSVVVMPLRAPRSITQDRIVYRPTEQEIGYYEYHRWAEDPRNEIAAALVHELREQGVFQTIASFDGRTTADYVLRGSLDRLEEVDYENGVKVYVALSAELLDGETARVVWQDSATVSREVSEGEVRAVVAQMSDAAQEAVESLTSSLERHLRSS